MRSLLFEIVRFVMVLTVTVTVSDGFAGDLPAKSGRRVAIVVVMRPKVEMESRVIRLGDVASISCSDLTLREKLKQLDLEDPLATGESVTISPARVELRIRVARIDASALTVQGPGSQVTGKASKISETVELVKAATDSIALPPPLAGDVENVEQNANRECLETQIADAAKRMVMEKLPWPLDSIDVRLAQPIVMGTRHGREGGDYSFSGDLKSSGPPVGRVHVRIVAEAPGKPMFEVPVVLDVRRFDQVVVTSKALPRGHVITEADLCVDRQNVTDVTDYSSTTQELIGAQLKRPIRALTPIKKNDLEEAKNPDKVILVKRRDQVQMVAQIAGANIIAIGEALQEGRMGDTIRLRNIESNATVRGRVTAANEVEILY